MTVSGAASMVRQTLPVSRLTVALHLRLTKTALLPEQSYFKSAETGAENTKVSKSLGRIRSYSEDRKPGSWLPEDQWAVRPPCSTCPDPSAPKKPKASKSWLSICKDPVDIPCDIRHNNCPPPKADDEPWYAFITKKKREKPKPPLSACRAELQRQAEMPDEEETCENLGDTGWPEDSPPCPPCPPDEPTCKERQPAPVIRLSCPPPKELDLMLWCGRPGLSVARIASQCQSDRMPYEEFRPRKCWKPPPYSLPCKSEAPIHQPFCCNVGRAPLAEFKQVEIPKPVYTRYKSVELEDENFLLCMTDARCPPDNCGPSLAIEPPPVKKAKPPPEEPKPEPCPEKPVLVAASRKPVKLRCAPKFTFRPKPTKLVEKRHFRNPCAQHKACNLSNIKPPEEEKPKEPIFVPPCSGEPPKVITSNITNEPPMYERSIPSKKPPLWMFVVSKPGANDTPLVPHLSRYPKEPDWCGETDGLKFYDDQNEGLFPKPPPDPCLERPEPPSAPPPCPPKPKPKIVAPVEQQEKFVLMPEKYNIRNMRPPEDKSKKDLSQATFQQFIEAKTENVKKCSKLYPQMKESILYDFVRNCPLPPMDPSKPDPPPRKPPEPECPQPTRFYYRRYSTFSPLRKSNATKHMNRMRSGDSKEKCKSKKLVPKPKECSVQKKEPSCDEMTLPCCPKAKIPPRCDGKKALPPCKKKLAPKPSYSECTKDPPPCPRNTECNAWEKRNMENQKKGPSKGRKFSSWAPDEAFVRDRQNMKTESAEVLPNSRSNSAALGPSFSEYLDLRERRQSLIKNKRASHINQKVFSGKELMLKFVNPTEDSNSYYTSESFVKRRKPQQLRKLKTVQSEETNVESCEGSQLHERKVITLLLQDHHTRNDARVKNLRVSHRVSGLGVYVESTFPRDVIGSIGTWISGLFKAMRKRPQSAPVSSVRKDQPLGMTYVETVDVHRIMKLTKPFRDRVRAKDDKVSYYTVDPLGGNQLRNKVPLPLRRLWGTQWNKSLLLFPKLSRERARSSMWKFEALSPTVKVEPEKEEPNINNGVSEIKLLPAPKESTVQKPSRLPVRKSEEYLPPVLENLGSRAVLMNRNLHEKQYDRSGQILGKNGFRYYTASVVEFPGERPRGVTSFHSQTERNMFIKKDVFKNKVAIKPKIQTARFAQSAARGASVLLRKDSPPRNLLSAKTEKERTSDEEIVPMTIPIKSRLHIDSNTKIGLRKAISSTILVKGKPRKWFEDFDFCRSEWKKDKKKSNGCIPRDDLKYSADKYMKRNEVMDVLSRLDVRKSAFSITEPALKIREKESKDILNMLEGDCCSRVPGRGIGRFSLRHALFRESGKHVRSNVTELADDSEEPVCSPIGLMKLPNGARAFDKSLSADNLPRALNNSLVLDDGSLETIHGIDNGRHDGETNHAKSQAQSRQRKTAVRTTSYDNLPLALLSPFKKEVSAADPTTTGTEIGPSKSYQAVMCLRTHAKVSEKPANNSDKTSKHDCRDSGARDKSNKDKPTCASKNVAKEGKKNDDIESSCRKHMKKKPGPSCPDG